MGRDVHVEQVGEATGHRCAAEALPEYLKDWFDFERDSLSMLLLAPVKPERHKSAPDAQEAFFGINRLN